MVGIALLDGVETVWNGDAAGQLIIVALEVHEGDGEECGRRSDM